MPAERSEDEMFRTDLDKVEERIKGYEALIRYLLEEYPKEALTAPQRMKELALERGFELLFHSFTDIAALLIDRFILRDPGSYEDMVDILVDEEILPPPSSSVWKEMISIYRRLTREYYRNEGATSLLSLLEQERDEFLLFPDRVRSFIRQEGL